MGTTPNYGWTYPTVGGSSDQWGELINAALIAIDAALATPTFQGVATGVTPAAGASGYASFRLPHGAAPTTNLTNGDLWSTTAGLFFRANGTTQQLAPLVSPTFTTPTLGVAGATSISFGDEALNKYDVGTWTPALNFGGSSGVSAYNGTPEGTYIKIGRLVFLRFRIRITTLGAATGDATISGMPSFGIASGSVAAGSLTSHTPGTGAPNFVSTTAPGLMLTNGTLYCMNGAVAMTHANFQSGMDFAGVLTYDAAS